MSVLFQRSCSPNDYFFNNNNFFAHANNKSLWNMTLSYQFDKFEFSVLVFYSEVPFGSFTAEICDTHNFIVRCIICLHIFLYIIYYYYQHKVIITNINY